MRILYLSPHRTHDIVSNVGYSTHQKEMIGALEALGHEVYPLIIGGSDTMSLPPETKRGGSSKLVKLIKPLIPGLIWRTLKDLMWFQHDRKVVQPRLKAAIESFQPELIYERSEYCLKAGTDLARVFNIVHILEVNAPCVEEWISFEGSSLLTQKARNIERYKYENSEGLCPVSSPLGHFLIKEYGVSSKKVRVVPNAIRPDYIDLDDRQTQEVYAGLGWGKDDIVIGFVGSVLEYHGVGTLVEAFIELQRNHSHVRLLIVGDGLLLEDLKQTVVDNSLESKVRFTGKVPHEKVFHYIGCMDICVSPKHSWYGSPIKIFEYAAMSKAIVAPDADNIRDVLVHGSTAHLIKAGDNELLDALDILVKNDAYRIALGDKARQHVLSEHLWQNNAEQVVQFAQDLQSE